MAKAARVMGIFVGSLMVLFILMEPPWDGIGSMGPWLQVIESFEKGQTLSWLLIGGAIFMALVYLGFSTIIVLGIEEIVYQRKRRRI